MNEAEKRGQSLDSYPGDEMQSYGQKIIGVGFNPAADDNVANVKQKMASVIDLLQLLRSKDVMKNKLIDMAEHDIIQAAMMTVKCLTFK